MTLIRFIYSCDNYNAGEVAGFSAEKAENLVARGLAVLLSEPEQAVPAPPQVAAAKAVKRAPKDKMLRGAIGK